MGAAPSMSLDRQLRSSPALEAAAEQAFAECTELSTGQGLHLYQIPHASALLYQYVCRNLNQTQAHGESDTDPLRRIQSKFDALAHAPTRLQIDTAIRDLKLDAKSESETQILWDRFWDFSVHLLKIMVLQQRHRRRVSAALLLGLGFAVAVSVLNPQKRTVVAACAVGAAASSYLYCC